MTSPVPAEATTTPANLPGRADGLPTDQTPVPARELSAEAIRDVLVLFVGRPDWLDDAVAMVLRAAMRVLAAAAPVIAAGAAAAQRDADIKLARHREATVVVWHGSGCASSENPHWDEAPFADLLAAAPDTTTTGKETR